MGKFATGNIYFELKQVVFLIKFRVIGEVSES